MTPNVLDNLRKTHASLCGPESLIVTHTANKSTSDEFEPYTTSTLLKDGLMYSNLNLHKMRLVNQIKAKRVSMSSHSVKREDLGACLEG